METFCKAHILYQSTLGLIGSWLFCIWFFTLVTMLVVSWCKKVKTFISNLPSQCLNFPECTLVFRGKERNIFVFKLLSRSDVLYALSRNLWGFGPFLLVVQQYLFGVAPASINMGIIAIWSRLTDLPPECESRQTLQYCKFYGFMPCGRKTLKKSTNTFMFQSTC